MGKRGRTYFMGWSWPRIEGTNISHATVYHEDRPIMAVQACGSSNASGQCSPDGVPDGYNACRRKACQKWLYG